MYFSPGDVYETVHRRTLYTNGFRMRADDISLPVGMLRFNTDHGPVVPVTLEITDRLEKLLPNGAESFHIATGGDELVEDFADVVSFGLDVVIAPDASQARRLVTGQGTKKMREKLLRRVMEPSRYIDNAEVDSLRALMEQLLALERPRFEAAMRAIRRVADAIALSNSDVTLAYTLFVAALESLSKDTIVSPLAWADYEKPKRVLVDNATTDCPPATRQKVRQAVLSIDAMSIRRRFQAFVLQHITSAYYREEAKDAKNPIRAVNLPKALDFAYRIRSQSMHDLRDLAPELWKISDDADTVWHDGQRVLTLEGLHRLSQHVIRQYIFRSPRGVDADFSGRYREALPGLVQVRLAPQMWVGGMESFAAPFGPALFTALFEMTINAMASQSESITDMNVPLARIEMLLRGEARASARLPLVATYRLWDMITPDEFKRPGSHAILETHGDLLDSPNIYGAAIGLLTGRELPWTDGEVSALADARRAELARSGKALLELPERLDAALRIDVSRRALIAGDLEAMRENLAEAIELAPGDARLLALESEPELLRSFDLAAFVLRPSADEPEVGAEERDSESQGTDNAR